MHHASWPQHRRRRSTLIALTAAAGLALAACAPDEEPTEDLVDDEVEQGTDPEDDAATEEEDREEDPESQAGDDLDDVDGLLLAVEPAYAEIGDGFTVTATLSEDADIQPGEYSIDLSTAEECES